MKKFFIAVVLLAGLAFLGLQIHQKVADSRKSAVRQRPNPPVAVEIAAVEKVTIEEVKSFSGTVYPLSEFIVAPKIAGRIEEILVHIGDTVESGHLVAVLDDDEYRQEVSQAKAELEVARANLQERENTIENAKREYERTEALREKKIASESELDAADSEYKTQQAKLKVAVAQVSQKEAELRMAGVRLAYTQIRIPENHTTGYRVVGERFADEGAMMAPNTPIFSVLDIGTLIAVIYVIERDYSKIQPGLPAAISTDAFPTRTFTGKVVRIAPLLKEKSREARVEIEIPNDERLLKPGMFVRVQIRFGRHENVTVVPSAALAKRKGTQGVFLVDLQEKKARFVPVTIGIVNGSRAEIRHPSITGMVVSLGHHLLEDGASVILPNPALAEKAEPDAEKPEKEKNQDAGPEGKP
jgi:RND family efflux transporter MFP subunit